MDEYTIRTHACGRRERERERERERRHDRRTELQTRFDATPSAPLDSFLRFVALATKLIPVGLGLGLSVRLPRVLRRRGSS